MSADCGFEIKGSKKSVSSDGKTIIEDWVPQTCHSDSWTELGLNEVRFISVYEVHIYD